MATTLTNKNNLPETLAMAMQHDSHRVAGTISVTQLIDAPQIVQLKRTNDIEEDVSERIYMLLGTAVHGILEKSNISSVRQNAFLLVIETLKEKAKIEDEQDFQKCADYLLSLIPSFFPEIKSRYIFEKTLQLDVNGRSLYGTFDIYDIEEKCLMDYKVTSTWNAVFPEGRAKWKAQLNVYSYMLEQNGYEVKSAKVIAIFRDWSKSKIFQNPDYPKAQVLEIPIPIVSMEARQQYIWGRMDKHIRAEKGEQIDCNGTEKWTKADEWAAMLKGGKRALKRFDTEASAIIWKQENQHKYIDMFIETRKGSNLRCEEYCSVREICPQRKRELTQK